MDIAQLFLDAADELDKADDASDASIPPSPSPSHRASTRSPSPFAPLLRRRSASAPPALASEVRRPEPAWSPAECAALERAKAAHGRQGWAAVKRAMAAEGWKGRALSSLEAQWTKPKLSVLAPGSFRRRRYWTPVEDQSLSNWLERSTALAKVDKRPDLGSWADKHPFLHQRSLPELVGRLEHLVRAGRADKLDTSKVVMLLFNLRGMCTETPPVVDALRPPKEIRRAAASTMSLMDRIVSKKNGAAVVVKVDPRPVQVSVPNARRMPPPPARLVVRSPAPSPSPPPPPQRHVRPPSPPAPLKMPQPGRPPSQAYFPSRALPPPARTTRWFTRPPIVDLPRYTHWVPPVLNVGHVALGPRSRPRAPPLPAPARAPPSVPALSRSSSTTAPSTSPPPVDLVAPVPVRPSAGGPRSMAHLLEPGPATAPPPPLQQQLLQSTVKSAGKRLWDVLDSDNSLTVFERRTRMRVGGRGGTWIDSGRQGGL
ncbi:hypothetical protein JCM9279_004607 [Rhodotorula babjevae]